MASGEDLVVGHLSIPAAELDEGFSTSGGPGGQHANRNETAVRLRFDVRESSLPADTKKKLIDRIGPVIEVVTAEQRSQLRNREIARARLVERIERALADPKRRRKTKPTRASRQRRLTDKRARSKTKQRRKKPRIDD